MESERVFYRYSEGFKLQVVGAIETGVFGIESARRRYGIVGTATIQNWIRRYGKNHLLGKVVRVEKPGERDRVAGLEQKIQELESALAQERVKTLALESLVYVTEKHYGVDLKKNFGQKPLARDKR